MKREPGNQRGAALILVLLLVATLSFIALAMSERTVLTASRSFNARARNEMLWRAVGIEALARKAIESAAEAGGGKLTRTSPLVAKQIDVPMEGGIARLRVADRTRCFNVNNLVSASSDADATTLNEQAVAELESLVMTAGASAVNFESLAAGLIDWMDADTLQEPNGAEDRLYSMLPAPYRTGGQRLADITELRAIASVDRLAYIELRPFLCALPSSDPAPINVNMLTEADAPLISAMVKGEVPPERIRDVIEARPPQGYAAEADFWGDDAFAGAPLSEETRSRVKLSSRYLEVNGTIEYYDASLDLRLLFEVGDDGRAQLLSRRLGAN